MFRPLIMVMALDQTVHFTLVAKPRLGNAIFCEAPASPPPHYFLGKFSCQLYRFCTMLEPALYR
jgi:hypothetical protein